MGKPMSDSNKIWISLYIFYQDLNFLLKEGIIPFVNHICEKESIEKYFFIRYNQEGSHIRLRMYVSKNDKAQIEEKTNRFFSKLLKENASTRQFDHADFRPNNTFSYHEYIPEIYRYGGEKAILEAEHHFFESSKAVLSLIDNQDSWDIGIAQAKAIQLYTIFFNAVELTDDAIKKMMHIMNNNHWKRRAMEIAKTNDIDTIFSNLYARQKEIIERSVGLVKTILVEDEIEPEWLKLFHESLVKTDGELDRIFSNGEIVFDSESNIFENNQSDAKARIYVSYLHMLNNRLGLNNHDESYMAFVLNELINSNLIRITS
jgi:thiopeptide-type bacteriocin biosynthesis protein